MKVDPVKLELDTASLSLGENRDTVELRMMPVPWDLDEDIVPADETGLLRLCVIARPLTYVVQGGLEAEFR